MAETAEIEAQRIQPKFKKIEKFEEIKLKPIKKKAIEFEHFKEIFVQPKEKMLEDLKIKEKKYEEMINEGMVN